MPPAGTDSAGGWRANLIWDDASLLALLGAVRTIAVIGLKGDPREVSHRIPAYMLGQGYRILPINPKLAGEVLLGAVVHGDLRSVQEPIDLVDLFRAAPHVPAHVDEILSCNARPAAVWMQTGIRHQDSAERLARAGVRVVQDRCLMIEHQRLLGSAHPGLSP